jgi:hypothetical protein
MDVNRKYFPYVDLPSSHLGSKNETGLPNRKPHLVAYTVSKQRLSSLGVSPERQSGELQYTA